MVTHHPNVIRAVLLLAAASCTGVAPDPATARGAVAAASPEATRAGLDVLRAGGNAVDAAIAVAFNLAVTEPAGSGVAGQAFFLIRRPGETPFVIRGTDSPAATPRDAGRADLVGRRATTVPSFPAVADLAFRRFGSGRVTWSSLLQAAAHDAEHGFALGAFRHGSVARYTTGLQVDPETARLFLARDGSAPAIGSIVRQPALARTIRRLAEVGARDFYEGEIARTIAADMAAHDGWMTFDDLRTFPEPEIVPALEGTYRGWNAYTLPPPAGGWVVLLALNLLEQMPTETLGANGPEAITWVAETLRAAHGMRVDDPVRTLDEYDDAIRRRVEKATADDLAGELGVPAPGSGETTHFCVADADGTVVSASLSLNAYFGARATCPELGLLYNDYMREFETGNPGHPFAIAPRAKPYSSMSATLLEHPNGAWIAVGSPGSRRIISAVVQVLRNCVDRQMSLVDAVGAPRMHVIPEDDDLMVEFRPTSQELIRALERRGMSVAVPVSSLVPGRLNLYFGGVHAVARRADGTWEAAADPRRDGLGLLLN